MVLNKDITSSAACDICGNRRYRIVYDKGRFDKNVRNVICLDCGLVCIDPDSIAVTSKDYYLREYFPETFGSAIPSQAYIKQVFRQGQSRYRFFEGSLQVSPMKVLEIGCGVGAQLRFIEDSLPNSKTVGIEPSIKFSRYAKEELGLKSIYHGFWQDHLDSFEPHSFDLIILSHVLEHFVSPRDFLLRIRDLLSPSGVLFVEVPDIMFPWGGLSHFFQAPHLFTFCKETLEKLLCLTSFDIVKRGRGDYNFLRILAKPSDGQKACADNNPAELIDRTMRFLSTYEHLYELSVSEPPALSENPEDIVRESALNGQSDVQGLHDVIGHVYLNNGDSGKAKPYFQKILEISPDWPDAYLNLGEICVEEKDFDEAEQIAKSGIAATDGHLGLEVLLGIVYLQKGLLKKAEEQFLKVLDYDESHANAYCQLAQTYESGGEMDRAIETLRLGVEKNPESTPIILLLGIDLTSADRLDEAERYLDRLLELTSTDDRVYYRLAQIYDRRGDHDGVMKILRRGLEKAPDSIIIKFALGTEFVKADQVDEAEQYLEQVLEVDDKHIGACLWLAKMYEKEEKWDEAERYLKRVLEVDDKHIGACLRLAKMYEQGGKIEGAIEILRLGVEGNPDSIPLAFTLGRKLAENNQPAEAEKYLKRVLELDGKHINAHLWLARTYENSGKVEDTIEILRLGVEKNPDSTNLLDRLGTMLYTNGKPEEAERYLAKLIGLNEKRVHVHCLLMNFYLDRSMIPQMEDVAAEALLYYPDDSDVQYLLFEYFCASKAFSKIEKLNFAFSEDGESRLLRLAFGRTRHRLGSVKAILTALPLASWLFVSFFKRMAHFRKA